MMAKISGTAVGITVLIVTMVLNQELIIIMPLKAKTNGSKHTAILHQNLERKFLRHILFQKRKKILLTGN